MFLHLLRSASQSHYLLLGQLCRIPTREVESCQQEMGLWFSVVEGLRPVSPTGSYHVRNTDTIVTWNSILFLFTDKCFWEALSVIWLSDACQIQDFHTTPTMWEEVILKNAEVNADTQTLQTFFFSLVTVSPWTKMTSLIHSFPVHQWRGLSSVPEDLFRSGGLPCGSLPATLPLLPKLWTHPGRQCQ